MHPQPGPAAVYHDVLDMIGRTPVLEFNRLDTGICSVFGKLEFLNPAGSVKDRIGKRMIEQAEADELLTPGGTIIEATAGNTGLGLALVAAVKGYKLIVVMPDKMSQEKIDHLQAMGAEVVMTRSDVAKGHPDYYQEVAQRIADDTGAFYVNQFGNPANVAAHYETTGPEIWEQLGGRVDAAVFGVGSGGSLSGTARYLKEQNPDIHIVLADPDGSILTPLVKTGTAPEPGSWLIEGIGEDFVPDILDLDLVTHAYTITDCEAFHAARNLLRTEGIFGGSSTGVLIATALRYCQEFSDKGEARRVAVLIPDTGNKYLRKMYSDFWMIEQGFIEREHFGDLRDLIVRRHQHHEDFTVAPSDTLSVAHGRMKLYDVSQIPVCVDDRIVGIIDESDLLLALHRHPEAFQDPLETHMVTKLETVHPAADLQELVPIFRAGKVALVSDEKKYYGMITQIDFLNHLRRSSTRS
ncbi:MAG: pyridoxal-phosphate dependent enzyme [Planctomycetes bacterium]|nr:pyridoxal-phosphate dependent enzyme [Planctomycetota bacterium]NOG53726.1 pyridoxal-phosphate dependent enzyme [Planctomycetota bacterium]